MFKKKRTFLLSCRMVPKHTYVQVLMWAYLAFLLWDGSHGYPVTPICCDVQTVFSLSCGMVPTVLVCLGSYLLWPLLAASSGNENRVACTLCKLCERLSHSTVLHWRGHNIKFVLMRDTNCEKKLLLMGIVRGKATIYVLCRGLCRQ